MAESAGTRSRIGACTLAAVLVFLLALAGPSFGATVIDDFTVTQNFVRNTVGSGTDSVAGAAANILGGQRDAVIHYTSGASNNIEWDVQGGFADLNVGFGIVGSGELVWNNGPFDLSADEQFLLEYLGCDQDVHLVMSVTGGATDTYDILIPANTVLSNTLVDFSNFAGVDFSNVTEIRISLPVPELTELVNPDCSIGQIVTQGIEFSCTKNMAAYQVNVGDHVPTAVTVETVGATGDVLVDVTDTLPAGLVCHDDPPACGSCAGFDCSGGGQILTWTDCPVSDASPLNLAYTLDVDAIGPAQTLCNDVTVTDPGTSDELAQCVDCVRGPNPEPPPPARVPTLSEWGMILFMFLAGIIAVYQLRRHHYGK